MDINKNIVENLLEKNNRTIQVLGTIAIAITSAIAIAGGYTFVKSNFWTPSVRIVAVDFSAAKAHLVINGKEKILYGSSTLSAGGEWGVRFGTTGDNNMYNIIQLVKNEMVYKTYTI